VSTIHHKPDESSLLAERLLIVRLLLLGVILLFGVGQYLFFPQEIREEGKVLFIPLVGLLSVSGLRALLPSRWKERLVFALGQIVVDVIFITAVVIGTGVTRSPFLFLYVLYGLGVAYLYPRWIALSSNLLSYCAYTVSLIVLRFGLIDVFDTDLTALSYFELFTQNISILLGLFFVSFGGAVVQRTVRLSRDMAEQSQRDLLEVSRRQQQVFDGIPEGIITTLPDYTVTSINASARTLLGGGTLSPGEPLASLLRRYGIAFHPYSSPLFSIPQEFCTSLPGERHARFFRFFGKCIQGIHRDGPPQSLMFILQDVTALRSAEEQLSIQERMSHLLSPENITQEEESTLHFLGRSGSLRGVYQVIAKVSNSDATVLVSGESGTGKEVTARFIHDSGNRRSEAFVPVNCGAIPESLIESELFGHKRGAFTGAHADHFGLFRQADRGTIFLDEIGELPLLLQTKLLRVLQERIVRPVGGEKDIPIDVRIIAATNKDLSLMVKKGTFREDLFYRLKVVDIHLPPLRERKDDIPLLINRISHKLLTKGEPSPQISTAALHILMEHHYPGNVRELENIIERALVLGGEVILPEHLPSDLSSYSPEGGRETHIVESDLTFPINLEELLASVEKRYLLLALERTKGARKKAASLLGLNFRSFRYRLTKFGLGAGSIDEDDK
jgi:two-component system, NtrC family, response regulator PilR